MGDHYELGHTSNPVRWFSWGDPPPHWAVLPNIVCRECGCSFWHRVSRGRMEVEEYHLRDCPHKHREAGGE